MQARKSIRNSVLLTLFFNFFGLLYSSFATFLVVGSLWLLGAFGLWRSTDDLLADSARCIRLAHSDSEGIAVTVSEDIEDAERVRLALSIASIRQRFAIIGDDEDIAMWRACSEDLEKVVFWQEFSERIYRKDIVDGTSGGRTTEHLYWATVKRAFEALFWTCVVIWPIAIVTGVFTTRRRNKKLAQGKQTVPET